MNISEPFIRRPVATTLVMAALAFVGLVAYPFLPVAPLPQVDFPTIQVTATWQGASAETMASSVASPLERQFAQIPGVTIDPSRVETNIVIFQLEDAVKTSEELRDAGVQLTRMDTPWMRAVTHLDVDRAGIERALEIFRQVLS